ncbi:MAG: cyanophycin synthetase [Bacteroidales bacterium]|nr:cyanophycin synthetase [Bacteroidales bacterium]
MNITEFPLHNSKNVFNSMAAGIPTRLFDLRKSEIKESLEDFQTLEHRLEFVNTVRGVDFINDSKATNINATWFALESMTKPVVWIVGGQDKGNGYGELKALVREKVKAVVCLGINNKKIYKNFKGDVDVMVNAMTAVEAVSIAYQLSEQGDIVLFSPACPSFDLYKNYEERGNKFKEAVRNL